MIRCSQKKHGNNKIILLKGLNKYCDYTNNKN